MNSAGTNACYCNTMPRLHPHLPCPHAGLEISIRNRYCYSLLFRYRMQNFVAFYFHYRTRLSPIFLPGKSILIIRCFFRLSKIFLKAIIYCFLHLDAFVSLAFNIILHLDIEEYVVWGKFRMDSDF